MSSVVGIIYCQREQDRRQVPKLISLCKSIETNLRFHRGFSSGVSGGGSTAGSATAIASATARGAAAGGAARGAVGGSELELDSESEPEESESGSLLELRSGDIGGARAGTLSPRGRRLRRGEHDG